MKKVDKLGRIVIPSALRRKYGLCAGAKIEFLDMGEGVAVKPSDPFCKICRAEISNVATLPLCEECMAQAARLYREKKNQ